MEASACAETSEMTSLVTELKMEWENINVHEIVLIKSVIEGGASMIYHRHGEKCNVKDSLKRQVPPN